MSDVEFGEVEEGQEYEMWCKCTLTVPSFLEGEKAATDGKGCPRQLLVHLC